MRKRNYAKQSSLFFRSMNGESILYRTILSFHTFLLRMAGIALLLGLWTPVVQAVPSIVEVRTASSNVIVAVVKTDETDVPAGDTTPDSLDLTVGPGHWQVDGGSPASPLPRYSIPWDEPPEYFIGSTKYIPVFTRHRIYLRLSNWLQEGHTYRIDSPYGTTNWTFSASNSYCESIKVNQAGYSKLSTSRFANFGVFMGDAGTTNFNQFHFEVKKESDGTVLTNGLSIDMGDDTGTASKNSGEHVYRLSLNYVPEGGPYYVSVPGVGRSRSFGIGDNYSSNIAYVTLRGMYHFRCGTPLTNPCTPFTHAFCHTNIYDALSTPGEDTQDDTIFDANSLPRMFIQGGYHDAGDMDHTYQHPIISVVMLSFYDAFTNHFVDNQYNIPESGNGVPDFLDECMWGIKMWEYLQITNTSSDQRLAGKLGGVRGGWTTNGYTAYGGTSAASDVLKYGTRDVSLDCTAFVAGLFAQASRLIRPYDAAHANTLSNQAQLAWSYCTGHANVNEPRTRYMYAALQLYLLTGDPTFHNIFRTAANTIILHNGQLLPDETYQPGNISYTCQTADFISYLIPNVPNPDTTLQQNLKSNILWFANTPNAPYMGLPPETQPYPQGVTSILEWGSGTSQGLYADVWMYATLFETDPVKLQNDVNAVCQYADFCLGLNPINMSYYTGLGTDQPNSPLDCDSYFTKYGATDGVTRNPDGTLDYHTNSAGVPFGNVPGICVYGPFDDREGWDYAMAVSGKMVPAWTALPQQRRYAHGHSLIHNNEFAVGGNMVWNIPMYAFLYTPGGLQPPSNLSLTVVSSSQINLSWHDNASTEDGFKIERKTGAGGTYSQIGTAGQNATTFNDPTVAANTTYYYRVRAYKGSTDTAYSNEAHATTAIPTAPTGLSATAVSSSQVNLGWTDNSDNETGFKVERKTGAGGTYAQIGTAGQNATTYSDVTVAANTTYYYRVRAYNALGDSGYSNEPNVTTPPAGGGQDVVYFDDAVPTGATTGAENDSWAGAWVSSPSPELGTLCLQSAIYSGEHQQFFSGASATLQINSGDTLYAYVYRDPNNPPTSIMLQWYDQSTGWEHRAYWGSDFFSGIGGTEGTPSKHQVSTTLPGANGAWVRLEVPASDVGLEGHTISGMAFTLFGGRAWWDNAGVSRAAPQDTVYVDDAVPTGATTGAENDTWVGAWVGSPSPELGTLCLQSSLSSGEHQQFFSGASATLQINSGDTLYAYIYQDPNNAPLSVMLQWYDQSTGWEHRAYWGPDFFSGIGGTEGTPSKHQESTSPPSTLGSWLRLSLPASDVGLEGHTISGMAFTLYGGRAWWDNAGKSH
jgi:endoglucanase